MEDICVCHSDPFVIDFDVLELWLEGKTASEAAKLRRSDIISPASYHVIMEDTQQQYQSFDLLERYLQNALTLNVQMLCNIPQECQTEIIQRYYEFDKEAVREILGKKMTTKLRKDMDDVSDKTKIPLKRCRRQFDNLKNMLKCYEDQEGNLNNVITKQFLLTGILARVYTCVMFVFVNRFETGKRKLNYLSFDDFIICADQLYRTWTVAGCKNNNYGSDDDDDFDRNFFQEIRDLRSTASERDVYEYQKGAVCSYIEGRGQASLAKAAEINFKGLMRSIWNIGCGLSNAKEVRDFFIDIVEKLIEPMKQLHWEKKDSALFLEAVLSSWPASKVTTSGSNGVRMSIAFDRYMKTLKKCLMQLYH